MDNTPLETHEVRGVTILVKREDLCAPEPGPAFSKIRGVYAHLKNRPESVIGVLDTFHSKAGWAVSYVCRELGKRAVNYWPTYKNNGVEPRHQQLMAQSFGALSVPLPAGRSAILYHAAKKDLAKRWPDAYMMPNALKLVESVTENAAEAERTLDQLPSGATIVISISSGTVAAGVIEGLRSSTSRFRFVLHMGYSRSVEATARYISSMTTLLDPLADVRFVDEGYSYADSAGDVSAPFPCNPYYDLKTWKWLCSPDVLEKYAARGPIVFWNIGA